MPGGKPCRVNVEIFSFPLQQPCCVISASCAVCEVQEGDGKEGKGRGGVKGGRGLVFSVAM